MMPCYLQLHVTTWWEWIAFIIVLSASNVFARWLIRRWGMLGPLAVVVILFAALWFIHGHGGGCQ